jgi:hypothetical protein
MPGTAISVNSIRPEFRCFQCNRCHHQTSLLSGTIYEQTKLPLSKWFLASYLFTQHKNGLSALTLPRQLGVSHKTAWRIYAAKWVQ